MSRYIDADKLMKVLEEDIPITDNPVEVMASAIAALEAQPTADVRENVKAHWIDMKPTGDSRFMCSRCKWKEEVPTIMGEPIVWDYCPSCGAVMRGDAVVEVVRCKDCKYYEPNGVCANINFLSVKPNDFCSYAERTEAGA